MLKNEASLMENEERRLREVGIFTLYDWRQGLVTVAFRDARSAYCGSTMSLYAL